MGIRDIHTTASDIEELADKLTLVYIEKSSETYSGPKELANRFVEIQKTIASELFKVRNG